MLIVLTALSV